MCSILRTGLPTITNGSLVLHFGRCGFLVPRSSRWRPWMGLVLPLIRNVRGWFDYLTIWLSPWKHRKEVTIKYYASCNIYMHPGDSETGRSDHRLSCEIVYGDRHLNKLRVGRQHSHLIILSNTLTIPILVASELTPLVIENAFLLFYDLPSTWSVSPKNKKKERIGGIFPPKCPWASSRHISGVLSRTPTPSSLFMNL